MTQSLVANLLPFWICAIAMSIAPALVGIDRSTEELQDMLWERVKAKYDEKEKIVPSDLMRRVERDLMLQIVDGQWKDHLYSLDHLKEGIGLRGYGQRDPLVGTKRKAFSSFRTCGDASRKRSFATSGGSGRSKARPNRRRRQCGHGQLPRDRSSCATTIPVPRKRRRSRAALRRREPVVRRSPTVGRGRRGLAETMPQSRRCDARSPRLDETTPAGAAAARNSRNAMGRRRSTVHSRKSTPSPSPVYGPRKEGNFQLKINHRPSTVGRRPYNS